VLAGLTRNRALPLLCSAKLGSRCPKKQCFFPPALNYIEEKMGLRGGNSPSDQSSILNNIEGIIEEIESELTKLRKRLKLTNNAMVSASFANLQSNCKLAEKILTNLL
jgi:hypothetical protein